MDIESQEKDMINSLKVLGIDTEKKLKVKDFDAYFLRKFLGKNQVSKIKNYELLIEDVTTLSKVYKTLDKIDISNISIDRIDTSNRRARIA